MNMRQIHLYYNQAIVSVIKLFRNNNKNNFASKCCKFLANLCKSSEILEQCHIKWWLDYSINGSVSYSFSCNFNCKETEIKLKARDPSQRNLLDFPLPKSPLTNSKVLTALIYIFGVRLAVQSLQYIKISGNLIFWTYYLNDRNNNIQGKMKPIIKIISTLVFTVQKHFPFLLEKKPYYMVHQKEISNDFTSMFMVVPLA
jgi:hypothetical protein